MAPSAETHTMPQPRNPVAVPSRLYVAAEAPSLPDFQKLCSQTLYQATYPLASTSLVNIPIYDMTTFSCEDAVTTNQLQDEWNHALLSGPGLIVLKNMVPNHALIEKVNDVFNSIITKEAATAKGDHFAAGGKNSRIWNSFQKHAELDPASFVEYYSNPWLALVCEAWLGVAYQITAQVNIVRPGGQPQVAHRDYHLGFQTAESCARFPKAMQIASQLLTLQGAVAHSDMPLESGPTRFLPFSQQFEEGYMAYRRPEFVEYFNKTWVSTPLGMGDAVFFNPALFHAAGENRTSDIHRSANLLQISSAFGKAMESLDPVKIVTCCWDSVSKTYQTGNQEAAVTSVKTMASGYPFPTNLDRRPPAPGGMAPESEAELLVRGLREAWSAEEAVSCLRQLRDDALA